MSPQRQHGTGVSQLREALYDLPIHTVETLAAPPSTTCPVSNGRRPAKARYGGEDGAGSGRAHGP